MLGIRTWSGLGVKPSYNSQTLTVKESAEVYSSTSYRPPSVNRLANCEKRSQIGKENYY